jgi:putative oxidoreductase
MDKLSRYAPYALAALRIVTALLFIQHGTAKLFGFPEMAGHGPGPSSPGGLSLLTFVGALPPRPSRRVPDAACRLPVGRGDGGGLLGHARADGRLLPAVQWRPVLFCFVFLYLIFAGPGALSLDGTRAQARGSS